MIGILGEIREFVGIVPEVVEEFVVAVVKIPNILIALIANPFKGRDALSDCKMFVEGFLPPIAWFSMAHDGFQTVALISFGRRDSGPVEKGGRQVEIERDGIGNLSLLRFGDAGVGNDERHAQGLIVVGPFPGEAAIAHVVAVVRRVDDNGVLREAFGIQCLEETTDGTVNAADHS